jgi:hypothetical protein
LTEHRTTGEGRGLTVEVTRAKERIDAARSAGVDATKARRALACLDQELADAKKRMIEEFHRVPSNPYA